MDWVDGGIDGQDEGKAEDLDNTVADDHLVHSVLLLLHDHRHRQGVEEDGEEKDGQSKPKAEDTRGLKIVNNQFCVVY